MKVVPLQEAEIDRCVKEAQRDGVVITHNGKPVAVIVGVKGMDMEQVELGLSDRFWELISAARKQKTYSRAEVEKRLAAKK